jgi:hypothetical protein
LAVNATQLFLKELKKNVPKEDMAEVHTAVLQEQFELKTKTQREDIKQVKEALSKTYECFYQMKFSVLIIL